MAPPLSARIELESMGYADAVIEGWPSNGSTRYYTFNAPIGWRAKRACSR